MTSQDLPSRSSSAFWITGAGEGEIRSTPVDDWPGESHVQVRTQFSAISRGTESLVFQANVPKSEYQRMRAPYQEGQFPYPIKYGYINVGVVERGPAQLLNQSVFCLYPHQERYVVPSHAVTLIPDAIPPGRAVLSANMETAVNALWDASPAIGDRISVIGGGVVGCLVAWLAGRIPGCQVELVDINPKRADIARALGVAFSLPDTASDQRDLIIHASASEAGLQRALELAAFEATIVELSWYGESAVSVPLGGAFHSQRLQLRSSQVGQIARCQRSRWDYARRLNLALSLLDEPVLDQLVSGETPFHELPVTFSNMCRPGVDALCHRIRYDHAD